MLTEQGRAADTRLQLVLLCCPSQCNEVAWRWLLLAFLKGGALTHTLVGDGNVDHLCGSLAAQIILCLLLWCCSYSYQASESSCGPKGTPGTRNAVSVSIIASLTKPCSSSGLSSSPSAQHVFPHLQSGTCMKVYINLGKEILSLSQESSVNPVTASAYIWAAVGLRGARPWAELCCPLPGWSFLPKRSTQYNWIRTWSTLMLLELFCGSACCFQ